MAEIFLEGNVEKEFSVFSRQFERMCSHKLKHAGKPLIPLIPVVSAVNHMELALKMTILQQNCEFAIRG